MNMFFYCKKIENAELRFLLFAGDRNMVEKYYKDFKNWLNNPIEKKVHIYFYDEVSEKFFKFSEDDNLIEYNN